MDQFFLNYCPVFNQDNTLGNEKPSSNRVNLRTVIIEEFTVSGKSFGALFYQIGQNYPLCSFITHNLLIIFSQLPY